MKAHKHSIFKEVSSCLNYSVPKDQKTLGRRSFSGVKNKKLASGEGLLAQRLEHLLHTQGVTGSSPVSPTIRKNNPQIPQFLPRQVLTYV